MALSHIAKGQALSVNSTYGKRSHWLIVGGLI
jgi:hypothetical protein